MLCFWLILLIKTKDYLKINNLFNHSRLYLNMNSTALYIHTLITYFSSVKSTYMAQMAKALALIWSFKGSTLTIGEM